MEPLLFLVSCVILLNLQFVTFYCCVLNFASFTLHGPSAWNAGPDYLKNSTLSLSVFRNQLKHFLFSSY